MSTTMIEIPSNVNVIGWKNKSTPIVQKKKRTVKKYKTPLAVRKKLAAARKKAKLPLVPIATVGVPLTLAVRSAMTTGGDLWHKLFIFLREYQSYYTGHWVDVNRQIHRDLDRMAIGLGPLAGLVIDSKYLHARAYANRLLGNANVPLLRV